MRCSICKRNNQPHYDKVRGEYVCGSCLCRYHKQQDPQYWGKWIPKYGSDASTTASILLELKDHLEYFLLRGRGDKELLERLFKEINELGNNPEYNNHEWDE